MNKRAEKFTPWALLLVPFAFWVYCFRYFFSGQLSLYADATPYFQHINFYTDNLSHGVFPLWDPTWFNGASNDFFLRRIGDVNPLLLLIVGLKWLGFEASNAYLVFLSVYYFLAGLAVYLIAKHLFKDRFYAFLAYILFLFSSWGSEVFYNYIIIVFLPIIWFFYFLIRFFNRPQKAPFLGMCFCVGLVLTTYIPFFFLDILAIFSILFVLFYLKTLPGLLAKCQVFINQNKVCVIFGILFILFSCIPGWNFYKESKAGNFVLPGRHSGSAESSEVTVGLQGAAGGDIISHGYFDRVFDDQKNIDMGDIYVPYIFFLFLLTALMARANKLIFFIFFNSLALSLIAIILGSKISRFLYDHVVVFRFIRQYYYFFWLAILPFGLLLCVAGLKSLLESIDHSRRKTAWVAYIVVCHAAFVLFLSTRQGVLSGVWMSIFLSLFYFVAYAKMKREISYPLGFGLFFLCVFIQSSQVYAFLDAKLFQDQKQTAVYYQSHKNPKNARLNLYYSSSWFAVLVDVIDPDVLENYRSHPFVFYDNVVPYTENQEFFKSLNKAMAGNINLAFIPHDESAESDWKTQPGAGLHADADPVSSGQLTVVHNDPGRVVLTTNLSHNEFLVVNDNYEKNWQVFINGHRARLFRTNVSFKGFWLHSGQSRVVLNYSGPYALHWGLLALFTGVFLSLFAFSLAEGEWGF